MQYNKFVIAELRIVFVVNESVMMRRIYNTFNGGLYSDANNLKTKNLLNVIQEYISIWVLGGSSFLKTENKKKSSHGT